MKNHINILIILIMIFCVNTFAQSYRVTINFSEYDVIFLTDFMSTKTKTLNSSASGLSIDIDYRQQIFYDKSIKKDEAKIGIELVFYTKVMVQLRGDDRPQVLVAGRSNNYVVRSIPFMLTSKDFTRDGTGIAAISESRYETRENEELRQRIIDLAKVNGTAPAGTYQIIFRVEDTQNNILGSDTKTIVIPYSGVAEAFVEVNEPQSGAYFTNLSPTFSWTTSAKNVVARVYEVGINHRSAQDALTGGNPHLVKELSGISTLTYPSDAPRQLQENKAYVFQVEAKLNTSRGSMGNYSRPIVFRISDDKVGKILDNILNSLSGDVSSKYATLRAEPSNWIYWMPYGNITLNGRNISETEMQSILNQIGTTEVELSIENQ